MQPQFEVPELADPRLPRPGDVIGGKYRVDAFIARGGMGAVLSATHQVTGRRLALKWLLHDPGNDAEASHRLVREAQAAARVRHPNVVDVYDIGEHDGALFLVMELLEGDTLAALLRQRGALDARETLELLLPAMRGVEVAHRNHVLHRDLKPSNIFLCRTPDSAQVTARVLDFGISKILTGAGDGERSLTRTGAVLGTPQYMAKEQLTSDDVDERADVYALGVILYQCLTGRLPFQDANYNALVVAIATATPTPIAQLTAGLRSGPPKGLDAVVMRAMAREPEARFRTVATLIDALLPFQNAAPTAQGTPHAPRPRRAWLLLLLATSVLAVLAAWALLRALPATEPAAPPRQLNRLAAEPTPSPTPVTQPPAAASAPAAQPAAERAANPQRAAHEAPSPSAQKPPLDKHRPHGHADPPERPVPISPDQF